MSGLDAFLSPSALLRAHDLRAKKPWGQNFLHDPAVAAAIVRASGATAADTVVEIGAGLGALTSLLAQAAGQVIAIERDRDLVAVLRAELGQRDNVQIVEDNALTFQISSLGRRVLVVGNLPYHISSQLLFRLIDQRRHISSATLMLQRELAQRLLASPGSRLYGAPSVSCRQFAQLESCLQVGRGAFTPAPRVDSTVIKLVMRDQPLCPVDESLFRAVVRAAFASRRKMLRRALTAAYAADRVDRALDLAEIDPTARAETLTVEQFGRLATALGV